MSRIFRLFFLFAITTTTFCTTAPKMDRRDRPEVERQSTFDLSLPNIDEKETLRKINQFEDALKRRGQKLTPADWKLHDELLSIYVKLKNRPIQGTHLNLPPHSRISVELPSFCLNSDRAGPADEEIFGWQKKDPGIPYYRDILRLSSAGEIKHSSTQTLLWNLQNKTRWENYPDDLKEVLKKIDPKAPFNLPSKIKDTLKDSAMEALKDQIPFSDKIENAVSFAEGQFYKYEDFARSVRDLTSSKPLKKVDGPIAIPETQLYSDIRPQGFSSQKITFYNPSDRYQKLVFSDYYLQPTREDVQRIAIHGPLDAHSDLLDHLEKALYGSMARLGIGFTPILGDVADIYELLTGKDFLTSDKLTWGERILSGVAVIAGSGAGYRYAMRAAYAPEEFIPKFERGFEQVAKREIQLTGDLSDARSLVTQTKTTQEAIQASPTLRNAIESPSFKKTDFYVRPNGEIIPSKGYRYVSSDAPYLKKLSDTGLIPARTEGNYISFKNFDSAKGVSTELQVPHDASIKVEFDTKQILEDVRIPNGRWGRADWLEPIAKDHPQFGQGGAYQAVTAERIQATRVIDLRTGKVLYGPK